MKLSAQQRLALLTAIHLAALPTYLAMPVVLLLFILSLSLWQLLIITRSNTTLISATINPRALIRLLLIFCSIWLIYYSYGRFLGRLPGTAMITLMALLKLFEIKTQRDIHIIIFTSFFILASHFFQSQQMLLAVYVFSVVIYLTTLLIVFSDQLQQTRFSQHLKTATRLVFISLPFMLILFILFPRIPGPLWGLPSDAFTASTGMDETMSPGSINKLVRSSAIAFRVKFQHSPPAYNNLYWRGAILSRYDGRTWRRDDPPVTDKLNLDTTTRAHNNLRYTVTLEPNNLNWLFALNYPIKNTQRYQINREAMLLTAAKITHITNYTVLSDSTAINRSLSAREALKYRQFPANFNPQTQQFARQKFKQSGYNVEEYIQIILRYFQQQPFFYTLSPPRLGRNSVDEFLFKTRRGFCEHYASSFTLLMRAAGIPARVVIGYMGGEINPLDNYMIVRQSDAHAWTEVWVNHHWRRIDPTSAISPERVEHGSLNTGREREHSAFLLQGSSQFLQQAGYLFDSIQNSWNQWVIGFNQQQQQYFLARLGLKNTDPAMLIIWLIVAMTVASFVIAWRLFYHSQRSSNKVQHYYSIFCKKLATANLPRCANEGALDYQYRLTGKSCKQHAFSEAEMIFILTAYRKVRYGTSPGEKLEKQFIYRVRAFRVRRPLLARLTLKR